MAPVTVKEMVAAEITEAAASFADVSIDWISTSSVYLT
jgi:hypothetical protein